MTPTTSLEKLEIKEGETVRFVVVNKGELVHEFNIGTPKSHAEHQPQMMEMMEKGVLEIDRIRHDKMQHGEGGMSHMPTARCWSLARPANLCGSSTQTRSSSSPATSQAIISPAWSDRSSSTTDRSNGGINMRIRNLTAAIVALGLSAPALAGEYNITVDRMKIDTGEFTRTGIGYNGSTTPTVLRFREGEDVVINVTNNLSEDTSSVHWHGLILPYQQDGVPGISFDGIKAGETFTYRFPIVQNGTYWFHSHSGFQEPDGAYGAIVIEPKEREPSAMTASTLSR